jgi:hypothetical protein
MNLKRPSIGALIAIGIVGMMLIIATAGLLSSNQTLAANGTIAGINLGIYSDYGCTTPITTVSWGTVTPGTQVTQTIYVKNTGNIGENLTMAINTWSPANAGTYLTIAWSPVLSTLATGQSTSATLTLAASAGAGAISSFSCNIVITGTQ